MLCCHVQVVHTAFCLYLWPSSVWGHVFVWMSFVRPPSHALPRRVAPCSQIKDTDETDKGGKRKKVCPSSKSKVKGIYCTYPLSPQLSLHLPLPCPCRRGSSAAAACLPRRGGRSFSPSTHLPAHAGDVHYFCYAFLPFPCAWFLLLASHFSACVFASRVSVAAILSGLCPQVRCDCSVATLKQVLPWIFLLFCSICPPLVPISFPMSVPAQGFRPRFLSSFWALPFCSLLSQELQSGPTIVYFPILLFVPCKYRSISLYPKYVASLLTAVCPTGAAFQGQPLLQCLSRAVLNLCAIDFQTGSAAFPLPFSYHF